MARYGDRRLLENSIAAALDPAAAGAAGDALLADLGAINAVNASLTPLKFVGMALIFSGIALVLLTIVQVLRFQASRLSEIALQVRGH